MPKSKLILVIVLSLLSTIFYPVSAMAETVSGQALEIAPPVINKSVDPGETVKAEISIRNVSTGTLIVSSVLNDFVANGVDGIPKILLDSSEVSPYSFKTWTDPLDELTLKAKQLQTLNVTIRVPKNAAPGGYYGVVRFTATPPELKGTGVSLTASLGALILLRVNGTATEEMSITGFTASSDGKTGSFFETAPIDFSVLLKNSGNIHEQPAGQITITDMFNKKIATVNVNLPVRNILPKSTRDFVQSLDKSVIGNKVLFGRYKATLNIVYGDNNTKLSKVIDFWVIPYKLITAFTFAIVVVFIILRSAVQKYNSHIINKAHHRNTGRRRR